MTSGFPLRRVGAICAALALLGATACNDEAPSGETTQGAPQAEVQTSEEPGNPMLEPEFGDDETVALPIGLISPPGYDWEVYDSAEGNNPERPHGQQVARTEAFGCQDYISIMQTVPMVTEDPAESAIEYLLSLDRSQHGSPAFRNPLATSGLRVADIEHEGDTVTVNVTGTVASSSVCQSWQILKQLETTARAATGAQSAELLLDGDPMSGALGLEDPGELTIHRLD